MELELARTPWWRQLVTRRMVVTAIATLLGVSCPWWPEPARPVCEAVGVVVHVALGLLPEHAGGTASSTRENPVLEPVTTPVQGTPESRPAARPEHAP